MRRDQEPLMVFGDQLLALLEAFAELDDRGTGPEAWARPHQGHPLCFLLDSLGDAVLVRTDEGEVLYRNRAAAELPPLHLPAEAFERLAVGAARYERRSIHMERNGTHLVLEVIHRVS